MANAYTYLIVALFLPLFPFSMVFNQAFVWARTSWARAALVLAWPQVGIWLLANQAVEVPGEVALWALLTALFYAYRALALRDVNQWIGFVATSAWALLWVGGVEGDALMVQALSFSLPLALLCLLAGGVERRFGGVHVALNLGLSTVTPRLAALFAVGVLAAMATPVFPGFFILLHAITGQFQGAPEMMLGVLAVWFLWTWSGARLMQGVLVGAPRVSGARDMALPMTWLYAGVFAVLGLSGLQLAGALL